MHIKRLWCLCPWILACMRPQFPVFSSFYSSCFLIYWLLNCLLFELFASKLVCNQLLHLNQQGHRTSILSCFVENKPVFLAEKKTSKENQPQESMTVQNHPRQVEDEGERAQNIGPTVELARIDTLHHDEATKVLGTYDGEKQWTDEEERRLRRKVDWSLMPIMCVTYALQYYDKNILSQAVSPAPCRAWNTFLFLLF